MSRPSKSSVAGVARHREWKQYIRTFLKMSGWTRKKLGAYLNVRRETVRDWFISAVPGRARMEEIRLQLESVCPGLSAHRPARVSIFNPFHEYSYDELLANARGVGLTPADKQQLLNRCAELLSRQILMTRSIVDTTMESNLGGNKPLIIQAVPVCSPEYEFQIHLSVTSTNEIAYSLVRVLNNMSDTPLSGHICDRNVLVLLRELRRLIPREEAETKAGGLGFHESSFSEAAAKKRILK